MVTVIVTVTITLYNNIRHRMNLFIIPTTSFFFFFQLHLLFTGMSMTEPELTELIKICFFQPPHLLDYSRFLLREGLMKGLRGVTVAL